MAITRRQFIKRSGLVTAGALLGPSVLMRQALAALEENDRYFVIVFLDGGNDGLNTVVPADDAGGLRTAYDAARSTIGITTGALTNSLIGLDPISGTQLAFHPGFNVPSNYFANGAGTGGLKALYDLGKVAVIQGCGYPEYSLSHELARATWKTGLALGGAAGNGWIGRHLAANYGGTQIPAVTIADTVAGELRNSSASVLAIRELEGFRFPLDEGFPGDDAAKTIALAALNQAAITGGPLPGLYIGETGNATLDSTAAYSGLSAAYDASRGTFGQRYGDIGRSMATDLREVARVIYGVENDVPNVDARFFQVSNSGYDTHADQGGAEPTGQHFSLHAELGAALKVFYDDLADMAPGLENRVCVLVWSEFSRRIPQNDNGTDHGSQGPMFVIGGSVQGGVYGNHPNIDDLALDYDGNTEYTQGANSSRSTDFRDVYGTILKHWVDLPSPTVEGLLPLDSTVDALADPDHYWRARNFDLGFVA